MFEKKKNQSLIWTDIWKPSQLTYLTNITSFLLIFAIMIYARINSQLSRACCSAL